MDNRPFHISIFLHKPQYFPYFQTFPSHKSMYLPILSWQIGAELVRSTGNQHAGSGFITTDNFLKTNAVRRSTPWAMYHIRTSTIKIIAQIWHSPSVSMIDGLLFYSLSIGLYLLAERRKEMGRSHFSPRIIPIVFLFHSRFLPMIIYIHMQLWYWGEYYLKYNLNQVKM